MNGEATDAQVASFLTAMRMKGETPDELAAAARIMQQSAEKIPVATDELLVDIVGTGGDGSYTFNISTAAAFVASGAGLRIAKHGNRAVSSRCGSADLIEALGICIDITPVMAARCIDEIGIGFLFAQTMHPAMRHVARARKQMGIRTMFNILGPLTNPAGADIQVVGVYDPALSKKIAGVLGHLNKKRAFVVHGHDGLDELSICSDTDIYDICDGAIRSYTVSPHDFGFAGYNAEDIRGGDPAQNAAIVLKVFEGQAGAPRDVVCLNAAAAIMAAGCADDLHEGIALARNAIDSGAAMKKLERLRAFVGSAL